MSDNAPWIAFYQDTLAAIVPPAKSEARDVAPAEAGVPPLNKETGESNGA